MTASHLSAKNVLIAGALVLGLFQSSPGQARDSEWVTRCSREYREKTVHPTEPNQSVSALESYLACVWVFVPGDGSDSPRAGDGGTNIGPGISAPSGQDISEKTCDNLSDQIAILRQKQRTLNQNRQALDAALKNSFDIADRARAENRAAQATASADRLDCQRVREMDELHRIVLANQRCKNRGLVREAFMDCVDLESAGIAKTPYSADIGKVCFVKATESTALADRTENAEKDADRAATAIFNQREDVARQLVRVTNELKRYQDEKRSRCP